MKKKYKTPLIFGVVAILIFALLFLAPIVQETAVTFASADTLYFGNSNPATFKIHLTDSTGFDKLEVKISSYDTQATRECSGNYFANPTLYACGTDSIATLSRCCQKYGWRDIVYGDSTGCGCYRTPEYVPAWVRLLYNGQEIGRMTGLQIGTTFDIAPQINQACASQIALWTTTRQGDGTACDIAFQFENDNGKGSMGLSLGSIANKEIAVPAPEPVITPEEPIIVPEPEIVPNPEPIIVIPPESQEPTPIPSVIPPPIDDSKPSFLETYKMYLYGALGIFLVLIVYALFYGGKKK